MAAFISRMIIKEANITLENGVNKYKEYFINTSIYEKWKESVDKILISKGYKTVIVTQEV